MLLKQAGQEAFKSITRSYYNNSACCLLVYDVTNRASFESIAYWLSEVKEMSKKTGVMVLVGNKIDLDKKYDFKQRSLF